jgi:hypothetical protein
MTLLSFIVSLPGALVSALITFITGLIHSSFRAIQRILSVPASLTRHYVSLLLSSVLYVFALFGIHPHGYTRDSKVEELQHVIQHLSSQADLYRTAMRELKDDLELTKSDRKSALKRLKSTKEEIQLLSEKLYVSGLGDSCYGEKLGGIATEESGRLGNSGQIGSPMIPPIAMQFSCVFCITSLVLCSNYGISLSVLEWKVVMAVGFPVVWLYLTSESSSRSRTEQGGTGGMKTMLLLCGMWWLVGFLSGAWVSRMEEGS